MTFLSFDGSRVDSFDAQQYAAIEDEINACCIRRDMAGAYAKLQERRALEALPGRVTRELRRRDFPRPARRRAVARRGGCRSNAFGLLVGSW